ncbi:hypothetical protein LINPERPRIM_LOCUS28773 [Linum perenne]
MFVVIVWVFLSPETFPVNFNAP